MLLPITAAAPKILDALGSATRLALSAPTGSGKTTQVPRILLGESSSGWLGASGRIVVLQPRRLATRLVAAHVARQMNVPLGGLVGFQTRHERSISSETRLAFLTEGLFLRQMLDRRDLPEIRCVVLDEFHERSLDADLILGMLRRLQESSRPDLRIVVMSATLDVQRVAAYLGAAVVDIEGRRFPVEVEHVRGHSPRQPWEQAADAALTVLDREPDGDLLIFMPGVHEITRTIGALRGALGAREVELHALHGSLPPAQQDRAVAPSRRRKVIVATNVAETSITIEGIVAVIDSGLARVHRHDPRRGINVLEVAPISQASADQRAGRAGRLRPGRCLRLWTQAEHVQRPEREEPEIRRLELSQAFLSLHGLGVSAPREFPWLDPPEERAAASAEALLRRLGAVDARGSLTAAGRRMVAFPVHPRLGRVLTEAAERGCLGRAMVWAALAGERDIVERPDHQRLRGRLAAGEPPSDLTVRESLLKEAAQRRLDPAWMEREGLSAGACRDALRTLEQLQDVARRAKLRAEQGTFEDLIGAMVLPFADHLAVKLDPARPHCAMPGRKRVLLDAASVVRDAGALLALEVREIGKGDRAETALSLATRVDMSILEQVFGGELRVIVEDRWNEAQSAMEQVQRRVLLLPEGELELGRTARTGACAGDAESAAVEIVERIMRGDLTLSRWDERVEQWMRRVRLVAAKVPQRSLIHYDDDDRRVILHEIVGDASRFSAVREKPCLDTVMNALSWEDQAFVRDMAPDAVRLPNGHVLRLEYPPEGPPIGRAKIQQLYGVEQTPSICHGRQPILLEILAPSQRPVQRTQDLANFWRVLYPEVKKELKRRYPRQEWR